MKLQAVHEAIDARMQDRPALMTALGSIDAIYAIDAPGEDATDTAVVVNIDIVGDNDTSDEDIDRLLVTFSVRVPRSDPYKLYTILDELKSAFHRYDLALSGAAASTHRTFGMRRRSGQRVAVEDPKRHVAYEMVYSLEINTL